ncbi:M28 family peptidase [bacterium]|nr:M28 family peptidase [bacterium]
MKKIYKLLMWVAFLIFSTLSAQNPIEDASNSITAEELMTHVQLLADEWFQGRDTPSIQLDSAANYISAQFLKSGLKGAGPDGNFFQTFEVYRPELDSPNTLSVIKNKIETMYKIKTDFVPLQETGNGRINNKELCFAGYGITAPEYNYDDYAGIDVTDKVVLIFTKEPQLDDNASIFAGTQLTEHAKIETKLINAKIHGAAGVLLLRNPHKKMRRPPNSWASLMRRPPKFTAKFKMQWINGRKPISMHISKKLSSTMLTGAETTLIDLFDTIENTAKPMSMNIEGIRVSMETQLRSEHKKTSNVWTLIEGSDPLLKDELIIVGAHYDHIGLQNGEVCNGADDNASGTAAIMEIAQALTLFNLKPKRSILLIAYTGEEKGLWGSTYNSRYQFSSDKTISAMICLDMISRNDPNTLNLVGHKSSNKLTAICEKANETIGMKIEKMTGLNPAGTIDWFRQSDHFPYYRKGIPVLFFNCGDTEHLHKPTDDVETISAIKMERITRLTFLTVWNAANATESPDFIKFR